MQLLTTILSKIVKSAFVANGYDDNFGYIVKSGRPDLCQFQCNGALAAAKSYHKSSMLIATSVVHGILGNSVIEKADVVSPGFINITINDNYLVKYVTAIYSDKYKGIPQVE